MASKKIIAEKQEQVKDILDKVNKSKGVVLVDYRGMASTATSDLRSDMRKENIEYKVLKNRLVLRAFKEAGYNDFDKILEGPTAIAFGYDDPTAPARIFKKHAKDGIPAFKAGIVEGKVMDAAAIEEVASIPSKEVLVAQLLGMLTMPLRGLAVALDQIAQKKA
ncbi:MAG: 50S ribosomal protein L10 [Firmicutes bacterium]|nr:50S ribosomal protein L10 [Bacillota bacterium]